MQLNKSKITIQAAHIWISLGVLLLGASLLFTKIADLSMWYSEAYTMFHTGGTYEQVFVRDLAYPSGFYQVVWVWRNLVGDHDVAAKILTALVGLISLSLLVQIGRQLHSWRAGWLIGLLFITSSYGLYYTLELRATSLGLFGLILAVWAHSRWFKQPTLKQGVIYALSVWVSLYFYYPNAFVLALLLVHVVLYRLNRLHWWLIIMALAGGAILITTPFLDMVRLFLSFRETNAFSTQVPRDGLYFLQLYSAGWWIGFAAIWGMGILGWARDRHDWRDGLWLFISGIGLSFLAYLTRSTGGFYNAAYLSPLIPMIFIFLGIGLARFSKSVWLRPVVFAAVLSFVFVPWQPFDYRPSYESSPPVRDMVRDLNEYMQPHDVLIVDPDCSCGSPLIWQYYESVYGEIARAAPDDFSQDGIWFLTTQTGRTNPIEDMLQDNRRETKFFGPWYFIATRYERIAQQNIQVGDTLLLQDFEVVESAPYRLLDTVTISTWWELENPIDVEYSFSLQLLHPDGSLVTQLDGPLQSDSQPTSNWEADTLYRNDSTLQIPDGLKGGDYLLNLIVYQWWDGQRLIFEPSVQEYFSLGELMVISYIEG